MENPNVILIAHSNNGLQHIIFKTVGEEKRIVCSVQLVSHSSFLQRLSEGIKYIIGGNSNKQHYSNFEVKPHHAIALMEVITRLTADNKYVKHGMEELTKEGYFDNSMGRDETTILHAKHVIELLSVFATQGHNFKTANKVISLFNKLAQNKTLSK